VVVRTAVFEVLGCIVWWLCSLVYGKFLAAQ